MHKDTLITYIKEFSAIRCIFHSEADFQLEFGMFLKNKGHKIRLEKSFSNIGIYTKIELDIEIDGEIAVELKYKTIDFSLNVNGEDFILKNHGAANLGRFDAFDDARRVRNLANSPNTKIKLGFALFLTNDSSYWLNDASRTMSREFSLIENRELIRGSSLNWDPVSAKVTSVSKNRLAPYSPILIDYSETLKWYDFSTLNNHKNGTFRFLVIDVNN